MGTNSEASRSMKIQDGDAAEVASSTTQYVPGDQAGVYARSSNLQSAAQEPTIA